jgi:hypothetical protein
MPAGDSATRAAHDALAREALDRMLATLPVGRAGELSAYLELLGTETPVDRPWLPRLRTELRTRGHVPLRPGADEVSVERGAAVVGGAHPLGRALARWAPSSIRIEDAASTAHPIAAPIASGVGGEPAATLVETGVQPVSQGHTPASDPFAAPEPRFFDRLLSLVGVHPTWNAPLDHPVVLSLERVLPRLPLPPDTAIAFAAGGRPVRFERGRVVIAPQHPVILGLTQAADFVTLAAAIVTEANRALGELTDAEERRAIVSLLLET